MKMGFISIILIIAKKLNFVIKNELNLDNSSPF